MCLVKVADATSSGVKGGRIYHSHLCSDYSSQNSPHLVRQWASLITTLITHATNS
ncbi:hypothetical protein PAXRUDRAFT_803918 [Paxillus rubicundulus Ve08.2h10]|uniref:Uncharacterized protein n=1 Tax=Paxillus rubicundulus Ve08.2h10 TaxID=930991 RepID=A0A0D0EBU8_9AGAM|nr:hypothetical protein PAXRUDRAFT_803918 [Paxillus rubicundulus Ve08.2h10]